jgi:hypothetical protein
VYFSGIGWMTFDPTPPGAESAGGILARLGQYMDWFELSWNEWVINYDFFHQILLAQNLQHSTRNWAAIGQEWFAKQQIKARRWMKSSAGGLSVLIPLGMMLLLVALRFEWVLTTLRRMWLSWQLRSPEVARANPQLASRIYGELLYLLARRGIERDATQTPMEFALALTQPGLAPAVQEFTVHYSRARFGGAACDIARLRALLDSIRAVLR